MASIELTNEQAQNLKSMLCNLRKRMASEECLNVYHHKSDYLDSDYHKNVEQRLEVLTTVIDQL